MNTNTNTNTNININTINYIDNIKEKITDSIATITAIELIGSPQTILLRLKTAMPEISDWTLLESAPLSNGDNNNWSYIAGVPLAILKSHGNGAALYSYSHSYNHHYLEEPFKPTPVIKPVIKHLKYWDNPFNALRAVLNPMTDFFNHKIHSVLPKLPIDLGFTAGWVGYLGYDLVRSIEELPSFAVADGGLPDLHLCLCDHVLAYHHQQEQWYFCTTSLPLYEVYKNIININNNINDDINDNIKSYINNINNTDSIKKHRQIIWMQTLYAALDTSKDISNSSHNADTIISSLPVFSAGKVQYQTSITDYLSQVQTVLDFIRAGDILQANLTHRLESTFTGDPLSLYHALTCVNPAPYSAYLQGNGFAIASVSPEQFLKVTKRHISARPIKGTRPRQVIPADDVAARASLAASIKDQAENVMIVDLMRNDLGRVAQIGTVKVPKLFDIEAHPSVWQMVSTITAILRADADVVDLLAACWPPGSMTGAPKIRAMEIIDGLEPVRRGVYSGAIGYFDVSGTMDLSVVIRTAIVNKQQVMVQVGGAIVADSVPIDELHETYAKGKKIFETLGWVL